MATLITDDLPTFYSINDAKSVYNPTVGAFGKLQCIIKTVHVE